MRACNFSLCHLNQHVHVIVISSFKGSPIQGCPTKCVWCTQVTWWWPSGLGHSNNLSVYELVTHAVSLTNNYFIVNIRYPILNHHILKMVKFFKSIRLLLKFNRRKGPKEMLMEMHWTVIIGFKILTTFIVWFYSNFS